ncbi:LLM class flavin-dependent oxidoreductase [Novosphingobium sp. MMS21-SN21R]|uniref:LLM class flavin-dependent oxidoreductase n=1 Tax=Novosphingobium sp. MMS21-SN21R TaxID=2969298 RepID=UPI0028880997|nr:LLM class flavin-dependent oxidoreductase [Novosphingobium sp. MMS21-SN21R]MDT0506410.1 LLM class flavin-dependent oxidoreductase [Novosphingobium sp. MMS21-SN21R]
MKLSVLDLVSVVEGGTVRDALNNAAAAAKVAEDCGYERYWVAEHHGMEGIASAAVSVVLAHIGHATSTIRIGSGGIMLPNHSPLVIAEQFGTLDALFPGRIDLGLGRAPGADQRIVRALRKDTNRAAEDFPQDVVELRAQFAGDPRVPLQATPGKGANPQMWILGSSLFGAQLAAMLGLPYAFASHFAPRQLDEALDLYRERFEPSETLAKPYCAAAINVIAADTDEEAQLLASSMDQSFVALRTGNPGKLKPPVPGYRNSLPDSAVSMLESVRRVSAVGTVETVREGLNAFATRTGADEIIAAASIFDQGARLHSLRLAMQAAKGLVPA